MSEISYSNHKSSMFRVEVVVISGSKKVVDDQTYYFIFVNDISDYLSAAMLKIQRHFQTTLTNGLSHERLTPLNGILLNTDLVLKRCQQ